MAKNNDRNPVKLAINDVKDALHETGHRAVANAERVKRTIARTSMSPIQKVVSHVLEVGHRTAAEVDKAKREIRHNR